MFQTFDATTTPDQGPPRLAALRQWMAQNQLDGFVVPRADRHQGEYVADCDARLAWLTGFTGSAGFACVLHDSAGVFIDGRYRIQVTTQVAQEFTPVHWPEIKLEDWLKENAKSGDLIGFDPWLHTVQQIETARDALDGTDIILTPTANGVDAIWNDRPLPPATAAWAHPIEMSGQSSRDKIALIANDIKTNGCDAAVITLPDSICWLLNIRGGDVPCTPIVQSFAVVTAQGRVALFGDQTKFAPLGPDPLIDQYEWSDFIDYLGRLEGKITIDPSSLPFAALTALRDGTADIIHKPDPCVLPKACKNEVELNGARAAHIRDGAAFVEFLTWFDDQDKTGLTEIDVVKALEGFRTNTGHLRDISFETISGSGPNAAIVHYRVTDESNRTLDKNNMLLLDSGGQYVDGTTDITRTLPIGVP
ncbi:MAG: aminopeptidase P family N-terminal domain-containing protein, partial [Planktomarina sp.]